MSTRLHRTDFLYSLERALVRHFRDGWLHINGRAMQIGDVIEVLQHYDVQTARTFPAPSIWRAHARITRDVFGHEVRPLLAGLREFLVEEFGPCSPRLREFGFTPKARSS
jgi:hypothetical protein